MRFRWPWVTIPVAILFCLWFLSGVSASFSFDEVAETMGVANTERYGQISAVAIIGVAIVLVMKLWKAK